MDTESCNSMKPEPNLSMEVRYRRKPTTLGTSTRYKATFFELGKMVGDGRQQSILRRNTRCGCHNFEYFVCKRLAEAVKMSAELPNEDDDEAEAERVQDDSEKAFAMSVRMWEREMELFDLKAHQWIWCSRTMRW